MTSAPDTKELEFALKVCRALDERAADLPATAAQRLAAARRLAVARKKPEPAHAPVFVPALAGIPGGGPTAGPRIRPLRRLALVWPILALLIGIVGIAYWENLQRAAELADIDAAMLNDDLPLNAYLDHGFNAYLSRAR